ncbi:MAG TPA: ABC transporter substrate-binding protein, partial [Bacillota bacterium]|nr:ABC transporter substrate-binding protein [Bacillota bacterium]
MNYKRLFFLLIMIGLITTLLSCQNQQPTDEETTTTDDSEQTTKSEQTEDSSDDVEYKDELNIAITAQPPTLDPSMTVSQVALNAASNIFETLFTLTEQYEPVPMLADSVDISDDGKQYTIKLREDIEFHNGKEMTSED